LPGEQATLFSVAQSSVASELVLLASAVGPDNSRNASPAAPLSLKRFLATRHY
jgi:hypothetical protein